MIHYHGTPLSPRTQLDNMAGRHFCVSFARPDDLATCLRIGASVMLDNGAFSAFTRGEPFNETAYYAWLEQHLAHPHWAVIPDVIDGTVEQQQAMVARWPFRKTLGAPVWHLGLPTSYLLQLCEQWPRVCLGSSGKYWKVGAPEWSARMDEVFNLLGECFGTIPHLHGLRMLSQTEGGWPLASADSTNVARNYKESLGCAECMANRVDARQPAHRWAARGAQLALAMEGST